MRATARIAFLSLVLFAQAAGAQTLQLAETYRARGTNADGTKYTGRVTLKVVSDTTFAVTWKVGGDTYRGFGMRWDDTLAVSYEGAGFKGVIMYRVLDNGTLDGRWTAGGANGVGTETLTPAQ
jgi:hypothetical protein